MTISKVDTSSEKLAALVVARYPKPELENAFRSFVWRSSDFEASVYERQRLEQNLVKAVRDGRSTPIVDSIYESTNGVSGARHLIPTLPIGLNAPFA